MPQSFTSLHFHIVFSTKDRRPMIGEDFRQRLYDYIGGILQEGVRNVVKTARHRV